MTFATTSNYALPYGAPPRRGALTFVEKLRLGSLWLVAAISGFVIIEPAPYEFAIMLSALIFVATGVRLREGHVPLLLILIFYNVGFATSLVQVIELDDTARWTVISCFLSLTSLFFAVALADDTERRVRVYMSGYILAAVMTSIIGVLAYFHLLPNSEMFIRALRAASTFKDPNVFGPFLILPGLFVVQRIMFGNFRAIVLNGVIMLIIAAGLFFAFSRGAWGNFAASCALMMGFLYITAPSKIGRAHV